MDRNSHILNAASNLLGIALLIVTGIHITANAGKSRADETALLAALLLSASCVASYLSIRSKTGGQRLEELADKIFLGGLLALVAAVSLLVLTMH